MTAPLLLATPLVAYLGPGGMLGGVGALIALGFAVLLALLGFVWLPIRRLMRAMRERKKNPDAEAASPGDART